MEEEFAVRTSREGTIDTNIEIEDTLNIMGGQGFKDRYCGTVAAVVEKSGGRITKQRLNWGEENDPKFNDAQMRNATVLLAAAVKALETSGGDPSELRVKFIVKK